jgi:hypothetical protein
MAAHRGRVDLRVAGLLEKGLGPLASRPDC